MTAVPHHHPTSPQEHDLDLEVRDRKQAPTWQAWLEVAALAALAIAARAFGDLPLAWLALAPLLAGLRYGACAGVVCAAAQVAALITAARWGATAAVPGGQAILGWIVAGLLSGQFCDAWARRRRQLEARARDHAHRLAGLARAYHLMVASHDQLQRETAGSPSSLRDALEALARDAAESDAGTIESLAPRILHLFRAHAAVRAAALHLVDPQGRALPAIATLGGAPACESDPLLREAALLGEVVSVRDLPAGAALVAVPLADVTGRVHAVVAVHELPFVFLHRDTLTLLAVLGGQLGDLLIRARASAHAVVKARATRAFCAAVSRSLRDARRYRIPAALAIVELQAPGEHQPRVLACLLAAHRRITDDAEVVIGNDGALRVVLLLRLADADGLQRYLARVEQLARTRAHELGSRCEIRLQGWPLDAAPLPKHPRDLELALAALLDSADPSTESSTSRRHHGLVA